VKKRKDADSAYGLRERAAGQTKPCDGLLGDAMSKILQIMPADGWKAAFYSPGDGSAWLVEPLVGWALVDEEDGYSPSVYGLTTIGLCYTNDAVDTVVDSADISTAFMAYIHPGPLSQADRDLLDETAREFGEDRERKRSAQ